KLANGMNLQNNNMTFDDYMHEWLETYKKETISPRTYKAYEQNIRLHILPTFGSVKLQDLTRVNYQKFINELLHKFSKKTVELIHITMHNALETAITELEIISKNPTNKVRMQSKQLIDTAEKIHCYDIDELESVLNYTLNKPGAIKYYSLFIFLSRTGLRIGECLALQWDDIDFKKKNIHINKTLLSTKRKEKIKFGPPKNKSSIRTISLDDSTLTLLKKVRMAQAKNLLKFGKYYKDYNFVFTNEDASCILQSAALSFFKQTCKEAGFKYITLHGFRHTHAVHLLQSGANIKYVSERLGHSTINMTADVYLHVTKSMEETAVNQYNNFLKTRGQIVGDIL
ncbi:TPA: tyrosine-type recombinase/integrase, partial [Bacillus cereus]